MTIRRAIIALTAVAAAGPLAGCISINVSDAKVDIERMSDPSRLVGTWDVALRFDPASPPSATTMVIAKASEGTLEGSFYGTPIQSGRITAHNGRWVLAGRTADQSGAYWHSARQMADGSFEGQTLSEGRNFLMTWRATRK